MASIRRVIAVILCCLFVPSQVAFAQSLTASASRLAREAAQPSGTSGPAPQNPYFWTGLGLVIGGGSAMLLSNSIWAVDDPGDIRCNVDDDFNVSCDTKVNKTLLVAGAGLAGVGAWLFFKGERMKNSPQITLAPGTATIRQKVRF